MLALTRKQNEVIVIGTGEGRVEITVVDIRGDRVRLGITAPRHVPVHRKEVAEAIAAGVPHDTPWTGDADKRGGR